MSGNSLHNIPSGVSRQIVDLPGDMIDRYRLIEPLGEGSFGSVWSAFQTEPVQRRVAIKMIKRGMDSDEITARFLAESQTLALMDHPNIAAILDVGTTNEGRPFFTMELVNGEPLADYCESRNLSHRDRLRLFIPVCNAVQHAHQKSVIHRDLKPSNILVSEVDGRPVPKIIDFGIAMGPADETVFASPNAIAGTLPYTSPEQLAHPSDIDTRSDVYSLGAVLYQLLTGKPPLVDDSISYEEALRRIREDSPQKPSACLAKDPNLQKARKYCHGEVDAIVMKALAKDLRWRYDTASALAEDIQRFLINLPVSARPPSTSYRFKKFARRNQIPLLAAALTIFVLVAGATISLKQAREARKSRWIAEQKKKEALINFTRAKSVVDQYLSRVTENPKLNEADFLKLRRDLLESAMPFFEELVKYTGSDWELLKNQAWAAGRLAEIYGSLGETGKSQEKYHLAISIDEQLIAQFPNNPLYQADLTLHCNNFGASIMPEDALPVLHRSLSIGRQLVARFPTNEVYLKGLMITLQNLGYALSELHRPMEATPLFNEALQIGKQLVALSPDDPENQAHLVTSLTNYASNRASTDSKSAIESYQEALSILNSLVEDSPKSYSYRGILATTLSNFGTTLAMAGQPDAAKEEIQQAIHINRRLVHEFPSMPSPRLQLATALLFLGDLDSAGNQFKSAEEVYNESLSIYRALSDQYPEVPQYAYQGSMALSRLTKISHIQSNWPQMEKQSADAIQLARQALALAPESVDYQNSWKVALFNHAIACLSNDEFDSGLADAIEFGKMLDESWQSNEAAALLFAAAVAELPEAKSDLRDSLGEQAAGFLEHAIELNYPKMDSFKDDPNFSSLRRFDAFMGLQPKPADLNDRSPSSFHFDYPHDDPGVRQWTKSGDRWIERFPSGKEDQFKSLLRIRVEGISGTEIENIADPTVHFFIPDIGAEQPYRFRMRSASGKWSNAGVITDLTE
ncbi:serine/threonine protein kinase [Luteolibacter pohnpeiensis]|uniref:Serine/threonine protein kinase n=1 Tax=Luteolibacter pohnpeiensis TaxID=454153 RepID=A0A934VUN2_9BACT|nr:serine/threonine-protein kinase [Luteolibacter pohnpeiensis]MBK1881315.1 serine/threonine protein kinase [Luteolibacter pohnpeiensis]